MSEKLKVLFQVSEARKGDFGVTTQKPVLEFTGEVDLNLEELRKVLSYVVVGSDFQQVLFEQPASTVSSALPPEATDIATLTQRLQQAIFEQSLSEPNVSRLSHLEATGIKALTEQDDWSYDQEITVTEPLPPKPKKLMTPRTPLVCQRCGRKFKGYTTRQKFCRKDDCRVVAAARAQALSTRKRVLNYPSDREAPTPLTPAVCQRCGRDYMAYSKSQKRCNLPDCKKIAVKRLDNTWRPQATIVAGQGVLAGTV